MSLAVDRYELGPVGTNGYVVRRDQAANEAVVFDPGGGAALPGRRLVRGLRGPPRPPVPRRGHAGGVDREAEGALPAGDDRLLGTRPRDHARRRARAHPLPGGAARLVKFEAPRGTHDVL